MDESLKDQIIYKNLGLESPRRSVFEEFVGSIFMGRLWFEFGALEGAQISEILERMMV